MTNNTPIIPTNRAAIISLSAGVVTLISFCIGIFPIPLTGYVCFPTSAILGIIAMVSGFSALGQIRKNGENGRTLALIGIWVGILTMIGIAGAIAIGVIALEAVAKFIQQLPK